MKKKPGGLKCTPDDVSRTRPHEIKAQPPGARKGPAKPQKMPWPTGRK